MLVLTDENFAEEIGKIAKPVLVDFFAEWCGPCRELAPVLEKLEKEFAKQIVFAKVNADSSPVVCRKYGINLIPTIFLLKEGRPLGEFAGLKTESEIEIWLEDLLEKEFIETCGDYAEKNGFRLNPDKETVRTIIRSLLKNERKQGFRYCPCRRLSGEAAEDRLKICPCYWHKEEIKNSGRCHCGLFVKN